MQRHRLGRLGEGTFDGVETGGDGFGILHVVERIVCVRDAALTVKHRQPRALAEIFVGPDLEQQAAIAELQTKLEQVQQRWQHDRIEAERTIRELLEQLTVRESSTMTQTPAREAA